MPNQYVRFTEKANPVNRYFLGYTFKWLLEVYPGCHQIDTGVKEGKILVRSEEIEFLSAQECTAMDLAKAGSSILDRELSDRIRDRLVEEDKRANPQRYMFDFFKPPT